MFHALIQSYADALYVATTLRPPLSPLPVCESECLPAAMRCAPTASPARGWPARHRRVVAGKARPRVRRDGCVRPAPVAEDLGNCRTERQRAVRSDASSIGRSPGDVGRSLT